jgi:hypothetical protein
MPNSKQGVRIAFRLDFIFIHWCSGQIGRERYIRRERERDKAEG